MKKAKCVRVRDFFQGDKQHALFMPLIFYGNILLNLIITLICPNISDLLRKVLVYGFLSFVMVIFIVNLKIKMDLWQKVVLAAYVLFLIVNVLGWTINGSWTAGEIVGNIFPAVFCSTFFVVGLLSMYCREREQHFLRISRGYIYGVGIFALIYSVYEIVMTPETPDVGIVSQMSLSYMFLAYLMLSVLNLIYDSRLSRKTKAVLIASSGELCMAIYVAGCKGALFCVFFALILIFCFGLINVALTGRKDILIFCLICSIATICAVLGSTQSNRNRQFVVELVKNEGLTEEVAETVHNDENGETSEAAHDNGLQEEIAKNELTNDVEALEDKRDAYVDRTRVGIRNIAVVLKWCEEVWGEEQKILEMHPEIAGNAVAQYVYYSEDLESDYDEKRITDIEYELYKEDAYILQKTSMGARLYLWGNAIREISDAPIKGHGLQYYQNKYRLYPHNVFLEAWVDMGILGILLGVGGVFSTIYMGLELIRQIKGRTDFMLLLWFLYIAFYFARDMLSGSFYSYEVLLRYSVALIYVIEAIVVKRRKTEGKRILSGTKTI